MKFQIEVVPQPDGTFDVDLDASDDLETRYYVESGLSLDQVQRFTAHVIKLELQAEPGGQKSTS